MRWVSVCGMVVLGSCVFVTRSDFEARAELLDEDGDGVPGSQDCNDRNALQSPELDEIPYDGLDNDCRGDGDVIDADGDGYPGVAEQDYVGTVYPEAFRGLPVDCADDPREIEGAALIWPDPSNPEVPYDGLDGKCDRSNDFDADGDGFMPAWVRVDGARIDVRQAFEDYLDRWGISRQEASAFVAGAGGDLEGPDAFADCDDTDALLYPGNGRKDALYDGIDDDCDGSNEFDADGDGFMPPRYEADFRAYLDRHFAGGPPDFPVPPVDAFGDCLDAPNPDLPGLVPAEVHPSVPGDPVEDAFYDGNDTDCARNNDFDRDGDGFTAVGVSEDTVAEYVARWGITDAERRAWADDNPAARLVDPPGGDDCDDLDPQVWPGAIETFAGVQDRDCDGSAGVGRLVFGQTAPDAPAGGFVFRGASNPEIVRLGDDYLILVAAETARLDETVGELVDTGVAIPIGLAESARRYFVPASPAYPEWRAATTPFAGPLDAAVHPAPPDVDGDGVPDPRVTTLLAELDAGVDNTVLVLRDLVLRTAAGNFTTPVPDRDPKASYVPVDLDVGYDGAGVAYGIACAPGGPLHAVRAVGGGAGATDPAGGDTCFVDAAPSGTDASVTSCAAGTCQAWRVDGAATWTAEGAPVADATTFGDQDDGVLARIASGAAAVGRLGNAPAPALAGLGTVVELDVHADGADLFVAGLVDDGGTTRLWLERLVGAGVDRREIPLDSPRLAGRTVDGVAVFGDADRLVVAVRAIGTDQDVIGWVFMNP